MQRRDFLRLASLTGVAVPSWAWTEAANAQTARYAGKILINIHADGGLDQSSWADPRERDGSINGYAAAGKPAGVAGNIRYAPLANNKAFFEKYYRQMLVINGIHGETNSHPRGVRVNATGQLDMGYPNIAELFASVYGKTLPMSWLTATGDIGGLNEGVGLVAAIAVPDPNSWRALTTPNAASVTNDLMKQADVTRIHLARAERLKALKQRADLLPMSRDVIGQFVQVANSRGLLQGTSVPTTLDTYSRAQLALICAQVGITSTIQLQVGGFDLHANHEAGLTTVLPNLTNLVDYVWQKSAELGIANRIFLRIFSDFGRTPYVNAGMGKDHWNVGTQILMEANPPWGNRVFGASSARHEALHINVVTGAVDPGGKVIRPRHVHAAMRRYLGIEATDAKFDLRVLPDEGFDFFNPNSRTGYPHL